MLHREKGLQQATVKVKNRRKLVEGTYPREKKQEGGTDKDGL